MDLKRYLAAFSGYTGLLAIGFIGALATLFFIVPSASAASCTYIGPAGGNWHTGANWSCFAVPGSSDSATLPPGVMVSATTAIVNPGDLTVGTGAVLDVIGHNLTVSNSTTTNSGTISDDGVMQFQGVVNSGTINETGTGSVNFFGDIQNSGSILTTAAGRLAQFGGSWTNTGTFDPDFLVYFSGSTNQTLPSSVTSVYGMSLVKTGGSKVTLQADLELTNAGLIMNGGGTQILDLGGFTFTNDGPDITINTGATMQNGTLAIVPTGGTSSLIFDNGITTNINMSVSSTGAVTLTPTPSDGGLELSGELTVAAGTIDFATAGRLTVNGTTTNAGTINNNGTLSFQATTTNSGTIGNGGTKTVAFSGPLTNSGAISIGSAYVDIAGWDNTGGTINPEAKIELWGSTDTTFPADITISYLNVTKVGGATVTFGGDVTSTGQTLLQGGTLSLGTHTLHTLSLYKTASGLLSPGTGTVEIIGSGSSQRLTNVPSLYDLRINTTGGSDVVTLRGDTDVSHQIRILSGLLALSSSASSSITFSGSGTGGSAPFQAGSSEFIPGDGTVKYTGSATTDIKGFNYYNLQATGAATYNLTASTTALGAVTIGNGSTLAVGGNDFTVLGTITNSGLMTVGAGSIIHPAESILLADSTGAALTTVYPGGDLYVTLQDSDQNLDGTSIETLTVTLSAPASMGSDSETLTLTETGVATGIFKNTTPLSVQLFDHGIVGDGLFEYSAAGTLTATWTDPGDGTDVTTDTVALSATAAAGTTTSSGGGGGGGGGIPAPVTTYQSHTSGATMVNNTGIPTHSLVKLVDDSNPATQADTAVYYIGADGKRHAFPNEQVYFSWYTDFSGVQILNADQLSAIALGKNITYKPGVRMVKFTTDPKVYAVGQGGMLRWITSEALAAELYGADWNTKIDDISDAFYTNYQFGLEIASMADYDLAAVLAGTQYPSDNF